MFKFKKNKNIKELKKEAENHECATLINSFEKYDCDKCLDTVIGTTRRCYAYKKTDGKINAECYETFNQKCKCEPKFVTKSKGI